MTYILFDIGGTNTRVAATNDLSSVGTIEKFPTPRTYTEGIAAIRDVARKLAGSEPIVAAAGGIRGPLSLDHGTLLSETVLGDWVGKPIRDELARAFGAPVTLENDAAVVALGEAHFGAGKGYGIVAYHTVSTGVGGARIVDGMIDKAHGGFEPGKQIVDADMTLPEKGRTLEELVSGSALEMRRGVKPYEIPQSDGVWDELARILAYGLKNTVVYWSPDVIVLGGSMIVGDPRILREDVERHLTEVLLGVITPPPIVDAALSDDGGLYGALSLLKMGES